MSSSFKGYLAGIVAAVSYGMNPLGAIYMYDDGMAPTSVLFYRFSFAALILALIIALRKSVSFKLNLKEAKALLVLGALFSASSLSYYSSFKYMDAGIACTILFFYPVMVAVIMAVFFKEKITLSTSLAIIMSLFGIFYLYMGDGNIKLSNTGMFLIVTSALTYAVYIVYINKSDIKMSSIKLTFYVLVVCAVMIAIFSEINGTPLQSIPTKRSLICAIGLAVVPTVVSLITMTIAVHLIGSTPTAIMGALEPLTAVAVGVVFLGEQLTYRLCIGATLIIVSVLIIIMGKAMKPELLLSPIHNFGKRIRKHWHWKY